MHSGLWGDPSSHMTTSIRLSEDHTAELSVPEGITHTIEPARPQPTPEHGGGPGIAAGQKEQPARAREDVEIP